MERSVGCWFDADINGTADVVLSVAVARDAAITGESLTVTLDGAPLAVAEIDDAHGGRLHHARGVGPGRLAVAYEASVDGRAQPSPVTELDLIRARLPSRYCESDSLAPFARAEFMPSQGMELVGRVVTWVHERVRYVAGTSGPTDGATSTLLSGQGVCRDFAHLVVALLRACDVPARLVSVYAPGLSPMDFHAVAEVYVDGGWVIVDATHLAPRATMLRIATGLDAAGTAFLTTFGDPVQMGGLEVGAVSDGPLPPDDGQSPTALG